MRILIVKTSSLGDIIHGFPVIKFLRSQYPNCEIDWVVEKPFAELVKAHPDISTVITIQTKKWRKEAFKKETWNEIKKFKDHLRFKKYDVLFDLQGNIKSGLISALARCPKKIGFGKTSVPEWPNLLFTNRKYDPPKAKNIRDDYLFLAQSYANVFRDIPEGIKLNISEDEKNKVKSIVNSSQLADGLKVMVCTGSIWPNKQLSINTLIPFLEKQHQNLKARFLFIWGSKEEKEVANKLNQHFSNSSIVVERLSLPTLQNLMASLDLVVSMDSLPLHLAGTTGIPTYSAFGASLASKYKPLGLVNEAFQGSCPYNKVFEKRCVILRTCTSGACIKQIDGNDLYNHFYSWWKNQ